MICRIRDTRIFVCLVFLLNAVLCTAAQGEPLRCAISSLGIAEGMPVYAIAQDQTGMVWLGTRDGLTSYDGYEERGYGLPGLGRILSLDVSGDSINVGCQRGNVIFSIGKGQYADSRPAKTDGQEWTKRMFGRNVTARVDIDSLVSCIGTGDSLILVERTTGRTLRRWQMPVVKTMLHCDSLLYVGTDDGLFLVLPDGSVERHNHDALFPATSIVGDVVWCLFNDRDGNIWIGTDNGVSIIESNPPVRWLSIPELTGGNRGNNIDNVLADSRGRLWLGGSNGLICVERLWQKGQAYRWYRMGDDRYRIPHNRIHHVCEDSRGRLWVSSDGGLLRYDEVSAQMWPVTVAEREHAWTYHVSEDSCGCLMVVMADTTYTLDGETLAVLQQKKTGRLNPTQTAADDGSGVFYATDRVGFADNAVIAKARCGLTPAITAVIVGGGRYIATDTVRSGRVEVPYSENNLTVTFSDFNYSATRLAQYHYSIDGGEWLPIDLGYNKIRLSNLTYGNHRLLVAPSPSCQGSDSVAIQIRVLPPWYLSWPMLALYCLIVITLIAVIVIYAVQRKTLCLEREQRESMLLLARRKEELLQRELVATVGNETEQTAAPSIDDTFLLGVTQLIEANLDNPNLSAAMLADLCEVSQKQLYRKIKQLTAMTTVEYIRHIRMRHAASLLANGNFTVAETMYRVGFTNASYFSRAFTAVHGLSPSEYRKEARVRNG